MEDSAEPGFSRATPAARAAFVSRAEAQRGPVLGQVLALLKALAAAAYTSDPAVASAVGYRAEAP